MASAPLEFRAIAEKALAFISEGSVIGLGTGRAATAFIHALGERVAAGLRIRCVPTSQASANLARQLEIPLVNLDEVDSIDVAVDGADEVDPACNLIKGYGGALVREKIVAASAKSFIVLVGPEKLVPILGSRGRLPAEVIPFGQAFCRRRLEALGFPSQLRQKDGQPFVTDNGNMILDCQVSALEKPIETEQAISDIPGVVGTGLFLAMADYVFIQDGQTAQVRRRSGS